MGRSKDLATGETRFANVAGDTFTGTVIHNGNVGIGTSPSVPLQVVKAGGANWMAQFQNTTSATPYGVNIYDASSASNGYPLLQVTNAAGSGVYFRVDSGTGTVTKPSQVSFKAHGTNNAYITTSPLAFPSISGRGGHNIGNHYNTSNSTFTAPVAGRYLFHVHIGIVRITSTGGYIYPNLEVNNASIMYTYNNQSFNNSGSWNQYANSHMTQIASLAANDVVRVTVQWGSADYYNGPGELSFAGCLLG